MTVRKKRRSAKIPVRPASKRIKKKLIKPPGLRVESLEPGQIVRFNPNPKEGTPDEYHIIVSSPFGIRKDSIRVEGKTNIITVDSLPCEVDWDYKLEILKDYSFMMSTKNGKTIGKLFKRKIKEK